MISNRARTELKFLNRLKFKLYSDAIPSSQRSFDDFLDSFDVWSFIRSLRPALLDKKHCFGMDIRFSREWRTNGSRWSRAQRCDLANNVWKLATSKKRNINHCFNYRQSVNVRVSRIFKELLAFCRVISIAEWFHSIQYLMHYDSECIDVARLWYIISFQRQVGAQMLRSEVEQLWNTNFVTALRLLEKRDGK